MSDRFTWAMALLGAIGRGELPRPPRALRRGVSRDLDSQARMLLLDPAAVAGERASGLPDAPGLPTSIPISP